MDIMQVFMNKEANEKLLKQLTARVDILGAAIDADRVRLDALITQWNAVNAANAVAAAAAGTGLVDRYGDFTHPTIGGTTTASVKK